MCEDIKVVKCSICGTTEKVMPEIEKEPICQTCFREVKTQQPRGKRLGASRTFDEIEEALQLPGRLLEIKVNHWRETVEIITEIDKELIQQAEVSDQKVADGKVLADCLAPLVGLGKLEQVQLDGDEINPDSIQEEEAVQFNEGGNTYFEGVVEIKCHTPDELTKEQIAEMARQAAEDSMNRHKHLLKDVRITSFSTDKLKAELEQLKMLRGLEEGARAIVDAAINDLIGRLL